jgi:dolichol-phosphate mannosyltransferase
MSGYFVIRRPFFMELIHRLRGNGFKILVDIFVSSNREVNFGEVGYSFRDRMRGESKLDLRTSMEYALLLLSNFTGDVIPLRFAAFAIVGSIGLIIHVSCLSLLVKGFHVGFMPAQTTSTVVAMVSNFFLNNVTTYRDRALRGTRLIQGLGTFCLACSFGAWSSLIVAHYLLLSGARWYLAGFAGVILSSVWNYSMTSLFTWQMPRKRESTAPEGGFSGLFESEAANASGEQP